MTRTAARLTALALLMAGAVAGCWLGTTPAEGPHAVPATPLRAVPSPTHSPTQPPYPSPTRSDRPSAQEPIPTPSPSPTPSDGSSSQDPTPSPSPTPAPTHTPQATQAPITYTVQAGDTLGAIALDHGVTVEAIVALNSLDDPDLIRVGQVLQLPTAGATAAMQPTFIPSPTPTPVLPTPEEMAATRPQLTPTPTATATPLTLASLHDRFLLQPMTHDWQRMNNCAPTTLAMALSFFGETLTQYDLAPVLKGSDADKNVSPAELAAYVRERGYGAVVRVNGDLETLMRLVSNGVPVIVEQWLDRPDDELTGHYRVVRGYDRPAQVIIVNDSYNGPELRLSYAEFERLWWPFNRLYIAVYRLEEEPRVFTILDDEMDDETMYQRAAAEARAGADADPQDLYAWFNLGSDLLALGEYHGAVEAFERAMAIGLPPRMLWYQFGPVEAYNKAGQYQKALDLSAAVLAVVPMIEELHYQRGVAYLGLGDEERAAEEFQATLGYNPRYHKAAVALAALEDGALRVRP